MKHPLGGYGETAFRVGESPVALPHIEIDVASGALTARRRGASPHDVERLVVAAETLLNSAPAPNRLICELAVLTDDLLDIGKDPDFWPRIVLDLKGRLFIRARGPEEAKAFMLVFHHCLRAGAFKGYSQWVQGPPISGGTEHRVAIEYDTVLVRRAVAKIACGLAWMHRARIPVDRSQLEEVRAYVRGDFPPKDEPSIVRHLCEPGALASWPEHHVAALTVVDGHLLGLVSLYGSCDTVDFGLASVEREAFPPVGAKCRRNGKRTQETNETELAEILPTLLSFVNQREPADALCLI